MTPMGVATHNVIGRLAASIGGYGSAAPQFEAALDVPRGGVLCALPALLAMGLLEGTDTYFTLPPGYYAADSLLMLLAFMVLNRMQSIEELRDDAPGEWGKLLGLDRVPEVRTLREKVQIMSQTGQPEEWSARLGQRWMGDAEGMDASASSANVLCIDGHVRVYHGQQTQLPKHYVAREKLCLRATVDYWVNALDGQPFMVINQVVDPGLIRSIEGEILPLLEARHPALAKPAPGEAEQAAEASITTDLALATLAGEFIPASAARRVPPRLTLVFDREGYSPEFFQRMRDKGIACLTYHKYPGPAWPQEEFQTSSVCLASGQVVSMRLAERGTCLSNGLWVREIRKLTERGHQTPILASDYLTPMETLASRMFARWSQENFFRYARMNFGLDRLADYRTEEITDPIQVVNPAYRALDSQVRSANGKLGRMLAQFGALNIEENIEAEKMEPFLATKSALHEQIEGLKTDIAKLKAERKATPHYVKIQDLPEADRFRKLATASKHFIDTIKIVAYRAECAMTNIVREWMPKPDQARALIANLHATEADILPDYANKSLTVRLHRSARAHTDVVIAKLCDELSATETVFPRTELRMIFKLGSA
jgi:hypothetical protein